MAFTVIMKADRKANETRRNREGCALLFYQKRRLTSNASGQDGEDCTLLSYRKRRLMGDASGQDGEGCMLQSYRQRRAMGWRPGSSWWAGSLPLSIKPASIFLPIHFPPDGSVICRQRRCGAMTDAARCDGRCNALRWTMQCAALDVAACCVFCPIPAPRAWQGGLRSLACHSKQKSCAMENTAQLFLF